MEIHVDGRLVSLLEEIAALQHREMADILQEAVEQYLSRQRAKEFDADVRRIIEEHRWLLDELAKS